MVLEDFKRRKGVTRKEEGAPDLLPPVSASPWVHPPIVGPACCTAHLLHYLLCTVFPPPSLHLFGCIPIVAPHNYTLHRVSVYYTVLPTQVLSLYLYWCIQNTMLHHIKSAALYKGTTMLLAAAPFTCSVYYTTHSIKICYALYKDILYSLKVEMSWEPDGGKGDALTLPTGLSILM